MTSFAFIEETQNMRNSVTNHFAKQKRNKNLVIHHHKKSKRNFVSKKQKTDAKFLFKSVSEQKREPEFCYETLRINIKKISYRRIRKQVIFRFETFCETKKNWNLVSNHCKTKSKEKELCIRVCFI